MGGSKETMIENICRRYNLVGEKKGESTRTCTWVRPAGVYTGVVWSTGFKDGQHKGRRGGIERLAQILEQEDFD